MPNIKINGIETYYEVRGSGQPVLLFHGGYGGAWTTVVPQQHTEWIDFLSPDRFMTITYDRRNAGRSQYTLEPFRQADLAADARALLDALGIETAIIYGVSGGGPIALQFVLDYPERVKALCLACTAAYLMHDRPRTRQILQFIEQSRSEGDRSLFEARKAALRRPVSLTGIRHPERREAETGRFKALQAALPGVSDEELFVYATGELRNMEAANGQDYANRLELISTPTIVVHGTADGTIPIEWAELLHKGIAGSEFHAIEGADHAVVTWPDATRVLTYWMERQILR